MKEGGRKPLLFCIALYFLPRSGGGGSGLCDPGGLCRTRAAPLLSLRHFFFRLLFHSSAASAGETARCDAAIRPEGGARVPATRLQIPDTDTIDIFIPMTRFTDGSPVDTDTDTLKKEFGVNKNNVKIKKYIHVERRPQLSTP